MAVAVGLVAASALAAGWWRILRIVERPSWPPGPRAVTAAAAQRATETFLRQTGPRPADLEIEYAWSTAASIEPWAEGRHFYPRILDDVARAQVSIHVLMYGWREGAIGWRMAELLERKRREGLDVRIVVSTLGSRPFREAKTMYRRLADAGAAIVANNTLPVDRDGLYRARTVDWLQDEVGRVDHRKLIVIDGAVAWTGGAGIEDHFVDGRFHDVMVRVTGDVVRQLQAVFLTSFRAYGGPMPPESGALAEHFRAPEDRGTIPAVVLQVIPGGFQSATQAIRERLDAVRQRLDIMNPYLTDAGMRERIIAAARRGVRVRIVTSGRANNWLAAAALRYHYADLIDAGVQIWEFPAVAHAKIVIADDWVQFGTVNLDAWALYRNFEIGVLARSARVVELFENRVFEPAIAGSAPGVPSSGFAGRSGGWLGDRLAYFL
jgi:phosphatidylserine/phosphatidylglycerophosphate/cardiolipin synthase-like enzyme